MELDTTRGSFTWNPQNYTFLERRPRNIKSANSNFCRSSSRGTCIHRNPFGFTNSEGNLNSYADPQTDGISNANAQSHGDAVCYSYTNQKAYPHGNWLIPPRCR